MEVECYNTQIMEVHCYVLEWVSWCRMTSEGKRLAVYANIDWYSSRFVGHVEYPSSSGTFPLLLQVILC